MKQVRKISIIFILVLLLSVFSEIKAINNVEEKQSVNSSLSNETQEDNKPKCKYKEGEVIITYEQSFWNKTANLTLDPIFNSYTIDETSEFKDIEIDPDKTISIASSDSQATTLAISLVKSDKHSTEELINILKNKDWIISVEPNYIIKSTSLTNDTYEQYQWALENTGQNSGIKDLDINPVSTSSENEKVIAVIDSGVDYTHEDIKNIMWTNPYSESELKGTHGYNFVDNNTDIMDDMYHGTHVAGIIASETNNKIGISGATLGASNIKIMALKVTDAGGAIGDTFSVIQAYNYIYKAQQLGINVVAINNSWGSYLQVEDDKEYMNSLVSAINLVGENGALSICAAGNESADLGKDGLKYLDLETVDEKGETILDEYGNPITKNVLCKSFPGCLDSEYIINVAASDEKDELASFSNYGESVDIAAPGTNILSTIPNKAHGSANEGADTRMFLPSIYDEEKRAKVCEQYWDFEDNTIEDIPFTVNTGTLSIADNKSFGTGKKSLRWDFTLNGDEESFPELKLGNDYVNNDFFSCMITAEIDGSDAFIVTGCKWKDENEEEWFTGHGEDRFSGNSDYWSKFGNFVWELNTDERENMNGIYVQVRNDGIPNQRGNYTIYIDDFGVSKPCSDEDVRVPYTFKYGTSMAAPFVTGAVGALSNLYENDTALKLKDKILSCTRKSTNLNGKVATGGILDLSNEEKLEVNLDGYNEINKDGNKYLENINPDTTIEEMIKNIKTNGTITVYKNNKEITDNKSKIETGMKIKISLNNESCEFITVVTGDSNGDGKAGIKDILQINKHRLHKAQLKNEYYEAGDVNKDGKVDIKDILQINKYRLGKISTFNSQGELYLYGFGDDYEDDTYLTLYNTRICYIAIKNIPISEKENIKLTIEDESIAEIQELSYGDNSNSVITAKIKGKKLGTTDIIASLTYNGINYTSKITTTVHKTNYRIILHCDDRVDLEGTSMKKNESLKLVATLVQGMASHCGDISAEATWSSDNETVVSVDNNGLVTAIEDGKATITAKYITDEGVTIEATYNIEVK